MIISDRALRSQTKADDFKVPLSLTVATVEVKQFPNEPGPSYLVYFREMDLATKLNKTNLRFFVGNFGKDTAGWVGKEVIGFKDLTVGNPKDPANPGGTRFRLPEAK